MAGRPIALRRGLALACAASLAAYSGGEAFAHHDSALGQIEPGIRLPKLSLMAAESEQVVFHPQVGYELRYFGTTLDGSADSADEFGSVYLQTLTPSVSVSFNRLRGGILVPVGWLRADSETDEGASVAGVGDVSAWAGWQVLGTSRWTLETRVGVSLPTGRYSDRDMLSVTSLRTDDPCR